MNKQRIIGKHALVLIARGQKEIASQVFVYDQIREIRVDIEALEVKVLMTYDNAYFRVFGMDKSQVKDINEATGVLLRFYNDLLNASMKLTEEEKENLRKQRETAIENNAEAQEQTEEVVIEETTSEEN